MSLFGPGIPGPAFGQDPNQDPAGNQITSPLINLFNAPGNAIPNLPGLLPGVVSSPFGLNQTTAPPVDQNYQRNLASLTNKYAALAPQVQQLPEAIRNALVDFDSARVANGSSPLTKDQTLAAMQTAVTNKPATPEPARNPLNLLTNFRNDASDILKSIPRLPLGLFHELGQIPNFADVMAQNEQQGMNPVAALLHAPGIRMIPGSYLLGNLAQGPEGIKTLITHPLMSILDAIPAADKLAEGTEVGRLASQAAEQSGARARPITAVLTGRVLRDADGNLVQGVTSTGAPDPYAALGRNQLGNIADTIRNDTRIGQALDAFGGARSRAVSQMRGQLEQRFNAMFSGYMNPQDAPEEFAQRAGTMFAQYTDEYPFLNTTRDFAGPAFDQQRADFYNTLQRDPSSINPALVNEYRGLMSDMATKLHADGKLGLFDNEWYDPQTAGKLRGAQDRIAHTQQMIGYRNSYLNPAPDMTVDGLRAMADQVTGQANSTLRGQTARAFEHTLDAYGIDVKPISSARTAMAQGRGTVADWRTTVDDALNSPDLTLQPRRNMQDIISTLRENRADPQAARLVDAVRRGDRNGTTAILKNLYDRKPPTFPEDAYPAFRDDVRSMARRQQFDENVGRRFTDARLNARQQNFERLRDASAPARFHGLLSDEVQSQATTRLQAAGEQALGRAMSPDEAGQVASSLLSRNWRAMPGLDVLDAQNIARQVEKDVTGTWRQLREAGADPVFVHRVSPGRANQALSGNINPIPVSPSQTRERVLDLSPSIQDVQVSVRHQAGEILQQQYNEQFVNQVIDKVGVPQSQLREQLQGETLDRMAKFPSLDYEAAFQSIVKQRYEKFNPEQAGSSWGGVKLNKYRAADGGEDFFIPKSIASNLHSYAKPPSIFTSVTDPITKAFRYSVIGLSPSVVVNNFFSNAVSMAAESGLTPWKYFSEARDWMKDPSLIPSDSLKAMVLQERPGMESISREAWLSSRTGTRFMSGFNAGQALMDSSAAEALRTGKTALDTVASKLMRMQMTADNMYRGMTYMDTVDKALKVGKTADQAEHAAMEMVRRTFVDFNSFTPIERSAMRTIIPFYSYLGHASRFIMRYPFDHPMRAAITAHIADQERERLGALPGSFLSMVPLPGFLGGGTDSKGHQTMIPLRPFEAFGDISNLMSVAGWMSATNPLLQTALQQIGVVRGEADLYPTLRYDPTTGRMAAVHGNPIMDLFNNTVPRAGLLTTALGLNNSYNDTASRDPAAAARSLVTMAGLPTIWRSVNPAQEAIRGEVARQKSASMVLNDALQSGNWQEAMRYPSLQDDLAQLLQESPQQIAQQTPGSPKSIAALVSQALARGK